MGTAQSEVVLTLNDIASLARVKRPVVSVWRSRSARTESPFPEPVGIEGGRELFASDDVARWLVTTQRGNNPHVEKELALFSTVRTGDGVSLFDATTALLALKSATQIPLGSLTEGDLLDLADDIDPHDRFAYRELETLGDRLPGVAAHVDAMTEAAYTPTTAFESLMSHRFRLGLPAYADTALAPDLLRLVARLTADLHTGAESLEAIVDPSGGSDLLTALGQHLPEGSSSSVLVGRSSSRLTWRRLVCQGWRVGEVGSDADDRLDFEGASLVVAQYPAPAAPDISDEQILTAIGDIALAMRPTDRAVIIAPARVLADEVGEAALDKLRSNLLRADRVRAIIRLPAGLRTTRPRQRLALWVLGPPHPEVAIADRWVAVADVTRTLDDAAAEDLITDVVAALGSYDEVHAHAFRFARLARTSRLVASEGSLVGRQPARPVRSDPDKAILAVRVQERVDALGRPPAVPSLRVNVGSGAAARMVTLQELVGAGVARVLPGNRLDPNHIDALAEVRVLGTKEVLGPGAPTWRGVSRLMFAQNYPAGRFTEPGDVVFCTTPSVGAVVDESGFSVVETPARVLRLDTFAEPRLVPHLVAQTIRHQPSRDWREWTVPLVPTDDTEAVTEALRSVASARSEAARRLAMLDDLSSALAEGLVSGSLITAADDDRQPQPTEEG